MQGRWMQILHNGETLTPISLGGDIDARSCSDSCSDSCSSVPALVRGARGGRPPARGARRACCRPPCHPVVRGARGGRHPARGATIDVSSVATGNVPTEHCGAEVACLLAPLFEIQLTSNMRSRPRRDTKNQAVTSLGTPGQRAHLRVEPSPQCSDCQWARLR